VLAAEGVEHLDVSSVVCRTAGLENDIGDGPGGKLVEEPLEALAPTPLGTVIEGTGAHDDQVIEVIPGYCLGDRRAALGVFVSPVQLDLPGQA